MKTERPKSRCDAGEAEIFSAAGKRTPGSRPDHERARLRRRIPSFKWCKPSLPDSWDRWNEDRDRYLQRSRELPTREPRRGGRRRSGSNGHWTQDPNYGQVWQPQRGPGLGALSERPLGLGRLLWLDLGELRSLGLGAVSLWPLVLGRGRMVLVSGIDLCALLTGRRLMVGFFGYGGGFGSASGFGFGGVGWVPLAPFEVFHPWWGRGFYGGFRGGAFRTVDSSSTT